MRTQQYRVYAAQEHVTRGHRFKDVAEAQAFVDGLRDTWWWQRWYWRIPYVEVTAQHSQAKTSVGGWDEEHNTGFMALTKTGLCVRTVVHELAHVVADALHNSKAHDPAYCRDFGNLMYLIMGSKAWLQLEAGFIANKVEY